MNKNELNKIDRRTFTKLASAAVAVPFFACSNDSSPIASDDNSTSSYSSAIDPDVVQDMMNAGIKNLTGLSDVGEAWKSIMPNLGANGTIAIKVNCRSAALPTHVEVANAVVAGLKQMNFDGAAFPENNIHIFDNYKAYLSESGYTINSSSTGVRCYQNNSYSNTSYNVNGITQNLSTLITDTADYLINIAVLKNHNSMAGATLCMKNHFGSCRNPRSMHINCGDPYIPALNALGPIKSKQCLNILDAIYGAHEGGPYGAPTFIANKIIMSQDIVAVDSIGRDMLVEKQSSTVSWASYIDSAANYGIGTNDPTQMEIINIKNPSTSESIETTPASSGNAAAKVVIVEDDSALA